MSGHVVPELHNLLVLAAHTFVSDLGHLSAFFQKLLLRTAVQLRVDEFRNGGKQCRGGNSRYGAVIEILDLSAGEGNGDL